MSTMVGREKKIQNKNKAASQKSGKARKSGTEAARHAEKRKRIHGWHSPAPPWQSALFFLSCQLGLEADLGSASGWFKRVYVIFLARMFFPTVFSEAR